MRGAVYHYDQDQDFGYINGTDGKRYIFSRNDLGQEAPLVRGTLVEFQPDDGAAHAIVAVASTTPSPTTGQPPRLVPVEGGTQVTHRLEISGPSAAEVGPELGPQISGDFDTSMAKLFEQAKELANGG